jgi:hypothetical protein
MGMIQYDPDKNEKAGYLEIDAAKSTMNPADRKTLLNLLWFITNTQEGRTLCRDNSPQPGEDYGDPALEKYRVALRAAFQDRGIIDAQLLYALVEGHLSARFWLQARNQGDIAGMDRYEKVYQQYLSVITWNLWEDAQAHDFSMNW